jgi:hypothetical protein
MPLSWHRRLACMPRANREQGRKFHPRMVWRRDDGGGRTSQKYRSPLSFELSCSLSCPLSHFQCRDSPKPLSLSRRSGLGVSGCRGFLEAASCCDLTRPAGDQQNARINSARSFSKTDRLLDAEWFEIKFLDDAVVAGVACEEGLPALHGGRRDQGIGQLHGMAQAVRLDIEHGLG